MILKIRYTVGMIKQIALLSAALCVGACGVGYAQEPDHLTFPILADGYAKFDPSKASERDSLKSMLGENAYSNLMKQVDKDKGYPVVVLSKQPVGSSTASDVAAVIKDMRSYICNVLKKGDEFKFTMAWDASAKVWGIGIGGTSGIEVTIKCGK